MQPIRFVQYYCMLLVRETKKLILLWHFLLLLPFFIHTLFHCGNEARVSVCACSKKERNTSQNYLAHTHAHIHRIVYMVWRRMFVVVFLFIIISLKWKKRNNQSTISEIILWNLMVLCKKVCEFLFSLRFVDWIEM